MNRYTSLIFSKTNKQTKIHTKWKVNFQGGRIGKFALFIYRGLAFRPKASPARPNSNTKKKKQTRINGNIQWGGRKFSPVFIRHNKSQNNIVRIIYNLWQITNIIRIVQTESYEANKPKICNRKWVYSCLCLSVYVCYFQTFDLDLISAAE